MEDLFITLAHATNDVEEIKDLLLRSELPFNDISGYLENFLVAKSDNKIIGTVGLEIYGKSGLLRSLAVSESFRNKEVGKKLYDAIIKFADENYIKEIYLLTTTADEYFNKLGFHTINRNEVPESIQNTTEFSSLCPSTAVCMYKDLNNRG